MKRHNHSQPAWNASPVVKQEVTAGLTTKKFKKLFITKGSDPTRLIETPITVRKFSVFWGIPMDEICFSLWFHNFTQLPVMPWDDIGVCMGTYITLARNSIHNGFLATNCDWGIMLDSDVMPPPDFLDKLLAHNKPFVGGWYRQKGGKNLPVVYDFDEELNARGEDAWRIRATPGTGLEKVDAAGAGCWLMHKSVAKAIGESPLTVTWGEDFELCQKVREAGFEVWIDWNISCAHVGVGMV
jgi:hypothetical protein